MKLPAAEQRGIFGNYCLSAASGGELTPKRMKLPAAEQRGIFGNYCLSAASGGELTPKRLKDY